MAEYFLNPQKYDDSALDEKLQNELDQYEFNPLMNQFLFIIFRTQHSNSTIGMNNFSMYLEQEKGNLQNFQNNLW
jgi:hypothetical protein